MVTRDVEPFSVVVRVPARTIRKLTMEEWMEDHPWFTRFAGTEPPVTAARR